MHCNVTNNLNRLIEQIEAATTVVRKRPHLRKQLLPDGLTTSVPTSVPIIASAPDLNTQPSTRKRD